jgi:hypothetical protein
MLTFRDITQIEKIANLSAENKMLSLFTSSVTHEMLTPLRCICQFATAIVKISRHPKTQKEAGLIFSTA